MSRNRLLVSRWLLVLVVNGSRLMVVLISISSLMKIFCLNGFGGMKWVSFRCLLVMVRIRKYI